MSEKDKKNQDKFNIPVNTMFGKKLTVETKSWQISVCLCVCLCVCAHNTIHHIMDKEQKGTNKHVWLYNNTEAALITLLL